MKTAGGAPQFTLYGTSACHLCELAEELLIALCRDNPGVVYEKVDISDSDALFDRYGVRIPVLRDAGGRELDWPFSAGQLLEFTGL
jgi:hypothetical protein